MCFETRDNNNEWNKNYTLAKNYYEHNGNLEIPEKLKTLNGYEYDENGINLRRWLAVQTQLYQKARLSTERINLLENIGIKWFAYNNITPTFTECLFGRTAEWPEGAGYAAWQKAKLPRFRLGVPDGTELAEEIDKLLDGSPSQTR